MGSIGDNGSGGLYAYRTSKAGANMVLKSLSCDTEVIQKCNMMITILGSGL